MAEYFKIGGKVKVVVPSADMHVASSRRWHGITGVVVTSTRMGGLSRVSLDRRPEGFIHPIVTIPNSWLEPLELTPFERDLRDYIREEMEELRCVW